MKKEQKEQNESARLEIIRFQLEYDVLATTGDDLPFVPNIH